jgi:hypothetical protein
MERVCLLIDNEDQTSSMEKIVREGNKQGLKINCLQFNVGGTERDDLLTDGKIDIQKVIDVFKTEFRRDKFHLIAFDWQLDDESINGVELIRLFDSKEIRKNTKKLLYSGVLKEEIQSLLEKYAKKEVDFKYAWNQINTLIRINIIDFVDRSEYEKAIVDIISKTDDPIDSIFEKKLREYPDLVFQNTYPMFEGKKLSELADLIETDVPKGSKFKNELIEQVVAYLLQMNNE